MSVQMSKLRNCNLNSRVWLHRAFYLLLSVCFVLQGIQIYCIEFEAEGPLDHAISNSLKSFYNLKCPNVGIDLGCTKRPKVYIINGRPDAERPKAANDTWSSLPNDWQVEIVKTESYLKAVKAQPSPCYRPRWRSNLFRVYQLIFADILERFPEDKGFIFVEDDAELVDLGVFEREVCHVQAEGWPFYSFFLTSSQRGRCLYEHGTVTFYATADFLRRLRNETDEVCRLPIDMFISSIGPWYATKELIVKHLGKRYIPNRNLPNTTWANETVAATS